MDWTSIGERAFNLYFNTYKKTESHDDAQEAVMENIGYDLEDAGVELENLWYEDEQIAEESIIQFGIAFVNKMKVINDEVGYEVDGDLLAVMHTWLDGVVIGCSEHKDYPQLAELMANL